jgi:hypothetical protein
MSKSKIIASANVRRALLPESYDVQKLSELGFSKIRRLAPQTKISKENATGVLPVSKVTSRTSPSCEQERDYVAHSWSLSIPKLMNSY